MCKYTIVYSTNPTGHLNLQSFEIKIKPHLIKLNICFLLFLQMYFWVWILEAGLLNQSNCVFCAVQCCQILFHTDCTIFYFQYLCRRSKHSPQICHQNKSSKLPYQCSCFFSLREMECAFRAQGSWTFIILYLSHISYNFLSELVFFCPF